eukprot:1151440-Pelagomonas_calceolata.AAC.4
MNKLREGQQFAGTTKIVMVGPWAKSVCYSSRLLDVSYGGNGILASAKSSSRHLVGACPSDAS